MARRSRGRTSRARSRVRKRGGSGKSFHARARKPRSAAKQKKDKKRKKDGETFSEGLVFVGMSFEQDDVQDVFVTVKDVCKSLKLKARRVDDNMTSGFVILEIADLIERAEFIVFDLTYERPNVYYELGYAHGVGNAPSNILLLAKKGSKLHFDIAALRVQLYKSKKSLRKVVKKALKEMIKESRA